MRTQIPQVALGHVLTQDTRYVTELELRKYSKLSVKLYGKGVVLDVATDGATVLMKRHQIARAGQVIVSEIWAKKGAVGIVPPEGDGALVTSHFYLFDIVGKQAFPGYVASLLRANYLESQLDEKARGTTGYAAVRPKQFLSLQIPLPPLSEQKRIVARIEELARKIEEARGLRREATAAGGTILSSVSGHVFGTISTSSHQRLADCVTRITKGESPSWQGFSYQDAGPLFLRSENVLWGKLDIKSAQKIPLEFHAKLVRSQLRPRDVLINLVGASIGRCCVVVDDIGDANINQAVAVITPEAKTLDSQYLMLCLNSSWAQKRIHGGKVETARANISLTDLRELTIPILSLSEQRRIVAYLDDLQSTVDSLKKLQAETSAELDALLPSILDQAFKGEL